MKRLMFILAIALLVAVGLTIVLQSDPGYVRVSFGNWLIETNLFVFSLLLIASVVVLIASFFMIKTIVTAKSRWRKWRGQVKGNKALSRTNEGLMAYMEGDWKSASKLLKSSAESSSKPVINYLAAAHAANEQGRESDVTQMLEQAYDSAEGDEFAVDLAKAQIDFENEEFEACLAKLLKLKAHKPKHSLVLKLLHRVYAALSDWEALSGLIPELKSAKVYSGSKLKKLEQATWRHLFHNTAERVLRKEQFSQGGSELARIWKRLPDSIRFEESVLVSYAEQLIRLGDSGEAETLLKKMLNQNWSSELLNIYGRVKGRDLAEQLVTAENWLKQRPNNAELLLALGRISLRNENWQKAQEYLTESVQQDPTNEATAELSRLRLQLDPQSDANKDTLQEVLKTLGLPELPLPARA